MLASPRFSFQDLLTVAHDEKMAVIPVITQMQGVTARAHGDCRLLNRLRAAKRLAIRLASNQRGE